MTAEQIVILVAAISIAVIALVGALAIWRALRRAGEGLRSASDRLETRAVTLAGQLRSMQGQLAAVDAQTERALWMLGNLDDRLDRATLDMRAKRLASDRLHLRLIDGRLTIARLKQLVRLLIRLGELRRVILQ